MEEDKSLLQKLQQTPFIKILVIITVITGAIASFSEDVTSISTTIEKTISNLSIDNKQEAEKKLIADADKLYFSGNKYTKAYPLYKQAADLGNIYAQATIAKLIYYGWSGAPHDEDRAIDLAENVISQLKKEANNSPENAYILAFLYDTGIGTVKNEKKSQNWDRISANSGFAPAQFNLSLAYSSGKGVKKDLETAFKLAYSAAQQNHLPAIYNVGRAYQYGLGVEKSLKQAEHYLQKAINKKYTLAYGTLGDLYQYHDIQENNLAKAIALYKQGAELGDELSEKELARAYYWGHGIEENKQKSFDIWQKYFKQGDKKLGYKLYPFYRKNIIPNIAPNDKKVIELLTAAAEENHINAQGQLARYLMKGVGQKLNKPNYKEAKYWAEKCITLPNSDCFIELALIYENGYGVEVDLNKAEKYYRKYIELGNYGTLYDLERVMLLSKKNKKEINRVLANLYEDAIKKSPDTSILYFQLAKFYLGVDGISKNESKVTQLYLKAAELGYGTAQNNIGYRYYKGIGTNPNLKKAKLWLIKSLKQGNSYAYNNLNKYRKNHPEWELDDDKFNKLWLDGLSYLKKDANLNMCKLNYLGERYETGNAAPKDIKKANELYLASAKNGSPAGAYNYGRMQIEEKAPLPDIQSGTRWLKLSAEKNWPQAHLLLAKMYSTDQYQMKDINKATEHFAKAKGLGAKINDEELDKFSNILLSNFIPKPLTCSANNV